MRVADPKNTVSEHNSKIMSLLLGCGEGEKRQQVDAQVQLCTTCAADLGP